MVLVQNFFDTTETKKNQVTANKMHDMAQYVAKNFSTQQAVNLMAL